MFSLFIVLLRFSSIVACTSKVSVSTRLFLNDETCIVRPILIDLNPVELKYYPFMISFNKCTGSCDVVSQKICIPKETKYINIKVFTMITNKNEAKARTEHISCDCKYEFNSTTCNSN